MNNKSENNYVFNFLYTFKISNIDIDKHDISTLFNDNDGIITEITNDGISIKQKYSEYLNSLYAEFKNDIVSKADKNLLNSMKANNLEVLPFYYGLDKRLNVQINAVSNCERKILGKNYFRCGLKPFIIHDDGIFFRGTSIVTYLGSNIFSLHLIVMLEDDLRILYDDAVVLSRTYFRNFDVSLADSNVKIGKGIESICDYYKPIISTCFKCGCVLYTTKPYEILQCIDYLPEDDNDIVFYLQQPITRDRFVNYKSNKINDIISTSDLTDFDDIKVHAYTHRAIIFDGELYKRIISKHELSEEDFLIFAFDQLTQFLVPIQRALGGYCIIDEILYQLRYKESYSVSELDLFSVSLELQLKKYLMDEQFKYFTVINMLDKIRELIGYNIVFGSLNNYIDSFKSILSERNTEKNIKTQNILTAFLGLISIVVGIEAIDKWVYILKNLGFKYAVYHPFRLTLLFWLLLFLSAFYLCIKLIINNSYNININSYLANMYGKFYKRKFKRYGLIKKKQ